MEIGGDGTHFDNPGHPTAEEVLPEELREMIEAVKAALQKPDGDLPPKEDLTRAAEQLQRMGYKYPDHQNKMYNLMQALEMRARQTEYI
jgi:hypothetical protein